MPVEDVNMAQALEDATKIFDATETITGFFADNGDVIAMFFVFIILLFMGLSFIYLFWLLFRHLNKK